MADPESQDKAALVRQTARETEDFQKLAEAFEERGNKLASSDSDLAVGSLLEAALVFEEDLTALEAAAHAYERVLELESDHKRALFALGLLLHDLARWDDLIALYRERIERTSDDGERTTLHLYIAEILGERLKDDPAAFVELMTAARLAPQNVRIISRLQKLGERVDRIDEVAVVIGDLILHQENPRVRAALSLRLAELHLGPLDDQERALAYLRSALVDDEGNPEILKDIEDVFRERKRFDDLAEILEETAGERRVGPHRVRLERELARIYELEIGDQARALAALQRAVTHSIDDRELLDEVMRLGLMTGDMGSVADTYEWVSQQTENALLKTYMRLKLGHIYANVLGRPEDAVRVYWEILDQEPMHAEARRRLRRIHENRGEHERLARILVLDAQELTGREAIPTLLQLGRIRGEHLSDPEGAVRAFQLVLETDANNAEALLGIEQASAQSGRGEPRDADAAGLQSRSLAEPMTQEAEEEAVSETEQTEGAQRQDLVPSEATIDGVDPEAALAALNAESKELIVSETDVLAEEVVEEPEIAAAEQPNEDALEVPTEPGLQVVEEPTDLPQVGEVEAESEAVVEPVAEPVAEPTEAPGFEEEEETEAPGFEEEEETEVPPAQEPVAPPPEVFADLVAETESAEPVEAAEVEAEVDAEVEPREPVLFERLERALEEATAANDTERMADLLTELVRSFEGIEEHERAFGAQVQLVELAPTRERVEETIRVGRRSQRLALLLTTVDNVVSDLPRQVQLSSGLSLVEVLEDLNEEDEAIRRLANLARIDPDDPEVFEHRTALLNQSQRFGELADVLTEHARRLPDMNASVEMLRRAAVLREKKLNDPAGAGVILIEMLERNPDLEDVRTDAILMLERTEQWSELAEVLESGLARQEGDVRVKARLKIAKLYFEKLDESDAAEMMLRSGLEENPTHPELLPALILLFEQTERWDDLVDMHIRRLEIVDSDRDRSVLRRKIAGIAEQRLGRLELALDMLESAAAEDPGDLHVLGEMERIRRDLEDWDGVHDVLVLKSRAENDPQERASTLVSIAELRSERYADLDGAVDCLREVLAMLPEHIAALSLLADVEERREEYHVCVDLLRQLTALVDVRTQAETLVRIGKIHETHFSDPETAEEQFEAAFEIDQECLPAVLALLGIAEDDGDFVRAQDLSARAAELSADERDQAALWRRAGQLAHERLGDELKGLEYYEKALAVDPEDLATEATVGELLLARQDFERAHPHLAKAAEGLSDRKRTASLYAAVGLACEKLERTDEAMTAYEEALKRGPNMRDPLERLGILRDEREEWQRSYELHATLVLHHEPHYAPKERSGIYLRMGRAKKGLGDLEAAVRMARKSTKLADDQLEPLTLLADVLEETGEAFDAAESLKRLSQLIEEPERRRDALLRAARLLADQQGDLPRACAMLSEAQENVPQDIEVAQLLSRHREQLGQGKAASEALTIPAQYLEGRPKAELLVQAARVAAGAARDRRRAKDLLLEAIELTPTMEDAWGDLSVMLEFDGDLAQLARLAEQRANAFLDDASTEADANGDRSASAKEMLDSALNLYRFHLELAEPALGIASRLLELEPESDRYREDYARLLDAVAETDLENADLARKATSAWSQIIEKEPGYVEGLKRLHLHLDRLGENHLARIPQEILTVLGEGAPPEEADEFEIRSGNADIPPDPLEESPLASLFGTLAYAPLHAFLDELPDPKPKKRDLVGAAGLGIHVTRPLEQSSMVLGKSELPKVYVRDDATVAVSPAYVADHPALIVSLAQSEQHTEAELRFLMGRSISLCRKRSLTLALVPLDVLRDGLAGFAKLVESSTTAFADPKTSKKRGKALEKALPSAVRAKAVEQVTSWLMDPERVTLGAEREAILRTADRAGLVASGSLTASIGALTSLSDGRVDRTWQVPLIRFAATRTFAEIIRGLH